jgi:hypothetical protein
VSGVVVLYLETGMGPKDARIRKMHGTERLTEPKDAQNRKMHQNASCVFWFCAFFGSVRVSMMHYPDAPVYS